MLFSLLLLTSLVGAVSITDIQGPAFQSPYVGQVVHNVTGIVSAKVSLVLSILKSRTDFT